MGVGAFVSLVEYYQLAGITAVVIPWERESAPNGNVHFSSAVPLAWRRGRLHNLLVFSGVSLCAGPSQRAKGA